MKITPVDSGIDLLKAQSEGRSLGLHASDIYGDFYQKVDPKRYSEEEGDPLLMAMGLGWERYLEPVLRANGIDARRPEPSRSRHGYDYSPDLIVRRSHESVGEIKQTFMSPTELSDPKFAKYHTQAMLYCYERELPRAEFFINHLITRYARKGVSAIYRPVFKHWAVEYSARELKENHQMLMRHARAMGVL